MKIAIPLFGTRISPRFDHAPRVLLACTADSGKTVEQHEILFQGSSFNERAQQLIQAGVDVVICGGISTQTTAQLKANSIDVIAWVTGEAQHALRLFLQGRLKQGAMLCQGQRSKRWRFCVQQRGCKQDQEEQ